MAAQLHFDSVVRGHHIYKSIWTPVLGEELSVEPENGNEHDRYAVSVKIIGRIWVPTYHWPKLQRFHIFLYLYQGNHFDKWPLQIPLAIVIVTT